MKIFIEFKQIPDAKLLKGSVARIAEHTGHELTGRKEAQLIITDSPGNAMWLLETNKEATLALAISVFDKGDAEKRLRTLSGEYPGRVESFRLISGEMFEFFEEKRGREKSPN